MAFQIFTREEAHAARAIRDGRIGQVTRIAIMKKGSMEMNAACMRAKFQTVDFVQLFFDPETRRIALKPATAADEHARKITRNRSHCGSFSATPFLRFHNIPFEKTFGYTAEWLDEPGAFVFKLDENELASEKPDHRSFLSESLHPVALKLFTQGDANASQKTCLTITSFGGMELNAACMRTHFKDVQFVQLLHDPEKHRIAVKRATAKDKHTCKMSVSKHDRSHFTGLAFLRHHEIHFEQTFRYAAQWLDDLDAFVINLDENKHPAKNQATSPTTTSTTTSTTSRNHQEATPMPFELFIKQDVPIETETRISISKTGTMHLSAECMRAQFKEVRFAQLYYDPENRLIAVKPATADDEHTYKVSQGKQSGAYITGRSFLKHNKIDFEKTHSFVVKWVDDPGALVIDLGDCQTKSK